MNEWTYLVTAICISISIILNKILALPIQKHWVVRFIPLEFLCTSPLGYENPDYYL